MGRVKEISFAAWDPDLATPPAMRTVPMARYAYDNAGPLRAVWYPRLDWNDAGLTMRQLRETYDYHRGRCPPQRHQTSRRGTVAAQAIPPCPRVTRGMAGYTR